MAGSGSGAAAAGNAAPAPAKTVRLSLESSPEGATVIGPDGTSLGETPLSVEWAASPTPVKLVFKLRGYRDKTVKVTVTANTVARAELAKLRSSSSSSKAPTEPRKDVKGMTGADGLERPD